MAAVFELWGQRGNHHFDVVGESHYTEAIRQVLGDAAKPEGAEVVVTAELLPEPGNRFDRNAVAVVAGGNLVGHLSADEAARYSPVLAGLTGRGWVPQVGARVWGAEWRDHDDRPTFRGSVRLDLAEPHMLVPANAAPGATHRHLPLGHAIQVSGEERHLEALLSFLRAEGECWAHATLHEIQGRPERPLVEVRLDGVRVGQLSPRMSGDLLPAIRHLTGDGLTTAARAVVKGNRLKAEVVLYAKRAHELPESWLQPVREHAPIPPAPTGVRFVVPPEWPQPPAGWTPPEGWRPEAAWPPAPDGWQWWQLVWGT